MSSQKWLWTATFESKNRSRDFDLPNAGNGWKANSIWRWRCVGECEVLFRRNFQWQKQPGLVGAEQRQWTLAWFPNQKPRTGGCWKLDQCTKVITVNLTKWLKLFAFRWGCKLPVFALQSFDGPHWTIFTRRQALTRKPQVVVWTDLKYNAVLNLSEAKNGHDMRRWDQLHMRTRFCLAGDQLFQVARWAFCIGGLWNQPEEPDSAGPLLTSHWESYGVAT